MIKYFHSVTLDDKRCRGCTNCIKHCPTEAIRVRKSKATIINERCIDCGVCIRVCPYHAKKAVADRPEDIEKYRYKIALPAPSLYGQYDFSRKKILAGLLKLGFDAIYEVAKGAELVTYTTNMLLDKPGNRYPLISSACPAVVKLIQVRFPDLIDHIIKIESPMEVSAAMAAEEALKKTGLPRSDIGIFFISPCAAKVTNVKAPYEKSSSAVNGVIAISEIYKNLLEACNRVDDADLDLDLDLAGFQGVVWADSGGEAAGIKKHKKLAVDGIHNVIDIFEKIENGELRDIEFIEALACTGGCLGGPLTVENPFVAKTILRSKEDVFVRKSEVYIPEEELNKYVWTNDIQYKPILKLNDDLGTALEMLEKLEEITESLPGLDCGACGAPGCRALAEDIVRGISVKSDCIVELKDKVKKLEQEIMHLKGQST
jgi:iron only hydrogenase large subunit-like protein